MILTVFGCVDTHLYHTADTSDSEFIRTAQKNYSEEEKSWVGTWHMGGHMRPHLAAAVTTGRDT